MKKRIFSAFVAGVTAAMFGVLYPEYIFLSDTYQYIIEKDCQTGIFSETGDNGLYEMLYADPDQIEISSGLLKCLADEGIVLWKNKSLDKVDMR